ncbi:MAG: hypothetical protein WKG03_00370 [Telluria sp.]
MQNADTFCTGKQGYLYKSLADRQARAASRRGATGKLLAYRCKQCALWHIGSSMAGPFRKKKYD